MGKQEYINSYNKSKYKIYSFRVRKDDLDIINKLEEVPNTTKYIVNLIKDNINPSILTMKQIRTTLKPIIEKHKIKEVYLFGSYARGEATSESDVDLYCDKGDVETFSNQLDLEEELEKALGKEIDLIFIGSTLHPFFKEQLDSDKLRIW